MDNVEIAGIVAALMQQFCGVPGIIDVGSGNRFGEDVITITVPTEEERESLGESIPGYYEGVRVHVIPMFGLGSFTQNSNDTKRFEELMFTSPYNVYGTPENKELDALAAKVQLQEREAWVAMSEEERIKAIKNMILSRRESGSQSFGNCMRE